MLIAGLASLGLPGLSGFVAEVTVFLGSLSAYPLATIVAVFGVVLAAGYILWMIERVFMGPAVERWAGLNDANAWWERVVMAVMVVPIFVIGIYPSVLTGVVKSGDWIKVIVGGAP